MNPLKIFSCAIVAVSDTLRKSVPCSVIASPVSSRTKAYGYRWAIVNFHGKKIFFFFPGTDIYIYIYIYIYI